MSAHAGELHENKDLLVWSTPIPKEIEALFTMVFTGVSGLINYICLVLTKTETFHLVIPLNCLGQLIKDRIDEFPQVVHIDVICNNIRELRQVQPWFAFGFDKIKFYTIDNLSMIWDRVLLRRELITPSSVDESVRTAIFSMIQARISAKLSDISNPRLQIVKQFVNTILYCFPVKNINDFASNYVCPSCKFVYGRICQLECEHQQCTICAQIQKRCATCSEDILREKVKANENLPMEMQNLPTHCSDCDLIQSLEYYQTHLKENHVESIIRFIYNEKIDDKAVTSFNGVCIWVIHNIEQIKNSARIDGRKSMYSPAFYLFPKGYKMCLRLFINGDEKGRNTHMSLFFVILRGEYDDKLRWPFEFKTTFSLIDQSTISDDLKHIDEDCWPNSTQECFECPWNDMNTGFGFPMYISLDTFTKYPNQYIKNNTMYIKFAMDPFAQKPIDLTINGRGDLPNEVRYVGTIDDDITDLICCSDSNESSPKAK